MPGDPRGVRLSSEEDVIVDCLGGEASCRAEGCKTLWHPGRGEGGGLATGEPGNGTGGG